MERFAQSDDMERLIG